ncbi:MAG: type II toxin-antitoxin system RelE/ParE family toxin, partial [Rubrimonas sp.]
MAYEVRRSVACRRDLAVILDHLIAAHLALGEGPDEAFERAVRRIRAIEDAIDALGAAPHQGTLRPDLMAGLRWVAKDRAVFYFVADDAAARVDLLAVFFGGQDHRARMLERILAAGD